MKRSLLLPLLFPLLTHAAELEKTNWGKFEYDFEEKPWVELEAQLPPAPKAENLLPFYVSAATDNRFYVDASSVSRGEDGVVRYTLVVQSASGARNVSYEGIRCNSAEIKRYAFGRADGSWGKARQTRWEPVRYKDINRHHHMLYDDFFCPRGIAVATTQEAVEALRRGMNPAAAGLSW